MKKAVDLLFWRLRRSRRLFSFALLAGILVFGITFSATTALAGFGITPPYVRSERLTRESEYKQQINLVRSDPQEDLNVEITLNIPEAQSWFTIDRGTQFVIPKGVTQMPIVVTVRVPKDAAYKAYKGSIRIRTSSVTPPAGGGVSIALAAQVDVAIKVVDKIFDFDVRQVRVADLEEGILKWGLFFPGKIRVFMKIENTGNAEFGPTRVHLDIYDSNGENLLESTDNTNKMERIAPFAIQEILAEVPTRMKAGAYSIKYTIYKNSDIAQQGQLNLSIAALGTVAGYEGYGFEGLSLADKLKIAAVLGLPILIIILLILALIARRNRMRKKKMNGYSSR